MVKDLAWEHFLVWRQMDRPVDWAAQFGRQAPLELEIGSGHGDFLLRTAGQNPAKNIVGIEQEWERVKKTLRKAELAASDRHSPVRLENLRILQVDINVALERLFLPRTLSAVYCLFPCPWPKKSHVKYRLFSPEFLRLLNSRMVNDGQVQIVTDAHFYFSWVRAQIPETGFEFEEHVVPAKFGTKFERKWSAGGQNEFYELRLFKKIHIDVPVLKDYPMRKYVTPNFDPQKFEWQDLCGLPSVVLKDFFFDPRQEKAMVHLLVAEKTLTQHLWVTIGRRCPDPLALGPRAVEKHEGWFINKTDGQSVVPTEGTARAMLMVAESIVRGSGGKFWATDDPDAADNV